MSNRNYQLLALLLISVPLIFAGCIGWPFSTTSTTTTTPSTTTTTPTTTTTVPVVQVWVDPTGITPKASATLSWNVTNATSVVIDQGIGSVPAAGSRVISPNASTTYTVTAYYSGGTVTGAVTLAVAAAGSPATSNPPGPYKDWVGSTYTHEYHYPSCTVAQHIPQPSKVWFDTTMQAQAAGYHPCPVCKPPH